MALHLQGQVIEQTQDVLCPWSCQRVQLSKQLPGQGRVRHNTHPAVGTSRLTSGLRQTFKPAAAGVEHPARARQIRRSTVLASGLEGLPTPPLIIQDNRHRAAMGVCCARQLPALGFAHGAQHQTHSNRPRQGAAHQAQQHENPVAYGAHDTEHSAALPLARTQPISHK